MAAPAATKSFCMSTTIIAVRAGSILSTFMDCHSFQSAFAAFALLPLVAACRVIEPRPGTVMRHGPTMAGTIEGCRSRQLIQQGLGRLQTRFIEAFIEPAIDWREQVVDFLPLTLRDPESHQA